MDLQHVKFVPELWTGNRGIDMQHAELVDRINELVDILTRAESMQDLPQVLQQLEHYVLFHFTHEEDLMRGSRQVPDEHVSLHVRQHADFTEYVRSQRLSLARPDMTRQTRAGAVHALHGYLTGWVASHIQNTDKELARLLATGRQSPA